MVSSCGDEGHRRPYVAAARAGLIAFVIATFVIAALIGLGLSPNKPRFSQEIESDSRARNYKATGPDCEPKSLSMIRSSAKRVAKTQKCADAEEGHREQEESIKQAARSAQAAEQYTNLTYTQGVATSWTVFFLILAFGASGWAAWAASAAANAAHRSVEKADETLRHAQLASERELRAYVYPEFVNAKRIEAGEWSVYIKIKNFGNTPAHDVDVNWGTSYEKWSDKGPVSWPTHTEHDRFGSLPPTDYVHFEVDVPKGVSLTALRKGTHAICICGFISYRTVFAEPGDRRVTLLRFYFGGDDQPLFADLTKESGAEMSVYENGNDAT